MLGHQTLETKMKRAEVLEGILVNNLSEQEIEWVYCMLDVVYLSITFGQTKFRRLDRIQELKDAIKQEDQEEERMIAYIKNRADAYVMLRYMLKFYVIQYNLRLCFSFLSFSLWNLSEILRHVDRPDKPSRIKYPNSYLRLPLLKFEMLTMRACPPEHYEENSNNFKIYI